MSEMRTVLCDMDGVIADLCTAWLARYNRDWGDALGVNDITAWSMTRFVKPECGAAIYDYLHEESLYDDVQPIDGALAGLTALSDAGFRVVLLTSCVNDGMVRGKLRWLQRHGFNDCIDCVIPLVSTQRGKSPDKSLIRGEFMVDDYHENLRTFSGRRILFHQPHNRNVDDFAMLRAMDWREVEFFIRRGT